MLTQNTLNPENKLNDQPLTEYKHNSKTPRIKGLYSSKLGFAICKIEQHPKRLYNLIVLYNYIKAKTQLSPENSKHSY